MRRYGLIIGLITPLVLVSLLHFTFAAVPSTSADFERTYPARGINHLRLSGFNGRITVTAWDKPSISVKAVTTNASLIEDRSFGDEIAIRVKRQFKPTRIDFDVLVPADTSVVLENVIGRIDLKGLNGHVRVSSIDSDVRLIAVNSESLDVKITSGDIFFDGDLHQGGSYSLQTMKGDIDVTLPKNTPFNLDARSLNADINLGAFFSDLTGGSKTSRGVSGNHLTGGPRLNLTTYAGKILLHKK